MPGVTIAKSRSEIVCRMTPISRGDATTPSSPQSAGRRAALQHLRAAPCVHIEDRYAQSSRFNASCGHGVGNVVKLQVKKNAAASGNYLPDNVRTGGGKELQTDLEHA